MRLISTEVLRSYMELRGETNRSLAAKATEHLRRKKIEATVKRGIVAHLRSGERTTCNPHTALGIESALNAPSNSLFLPEVANGQMSDSRRRALSA